MLKQEWLRGSRRNQRGVRLALPDYDLSRVGVANRVASDMEDNLKAGDFVAVHISLPCTPWCTWHHIASSVSPDYASRVEAHRRRSRNMLKLTISMLRRLLPYGPRFRASFGWPRNPDGWNLRKCPEIRQLTQLLRHGCSIDSCAYGLRDRAGEPVRKPWRIQTNDSAFVNKVRKPPVPRTSSS